VEIDCREISGIVIGVVAEELEVTKVVLRCLTIRASKTSCYLLDSVLNPAGRST
jgi:hypothetical protein